MHPKGATARVLGYTVGIIPVHDCNADGAWVSGVGMAAWLGVRLLAGMGWDGMGRMVGRSLAGWLDEQCALRGCAISKSACCSIVFIVNKVSAPHSHPFIVSILIFRWDPRHESSRRRTRSPRGRTRPPVSTPSLRWVSRLVTRGRCLVGSRRNNQE